MSKKKKSGQMTENVNIQGDTEILLMDDDDCELNFDEDTGNGNDDAEQTLGNSDEDSYDVPDDVRDFCDEVLEYFSDKVALRTFLHSAAFYDYVEISKMNHEMNEVVREIRKRFLDYIAIYEASDSDGIDATEMIKNLNRINVDSALDRANSILQLMREITNHRMQVS